MTDSTSPLDVPGGGHPIAPGPPSTADLAKSVQALKNWLIVLTVVVALAFTAAVGAVIVALIGLASSGMFLGTGLDGFATGIGPDSVPQGPPLTSVASLPVDADGEGTIQGAPTGEAMTGEGSGTFKLVLEPAPAGLPPRTTLHVGFDRSTRVYRNGQELGDPLTAMESEDGPFEADPSAAGTVIVTFHIRDGRAFADRLDLSDDFPPGIEP